MSESVVRQRAENRWPGGEESAEPAAVNGTALPKPGAGRLSLLIAKSLQDVSMEDDDFRFIAKVVHDRAGIALTTKKRAMVYARLSRRVRELGMTSFGEYRKRLEDGSNEEEMGSLVNALTTNYTKFFREEHHFDHMTEELIPALMRQSQASGKRRLRVWSAGCSSGEEAYSIAMTLRHSFPGLEGWDAKVLATDIDTNVLTQAEFWSLFQQAGRRYSRRFPRQICPRRRSVQPEIPGRRPCAQPGGLQAAQPDRTLADEG